MPGPEKPGGKQGKWGQGGQAANVVSFYKIRDEIEKEPLFEGRRGKRLRDACLTCGGKYSKVRGIRYKNPRGSEEHGLGGDRWGPSWEGREGNLELL